MTEPSPLLRLPNELILHILGFLPHRSLFEASHTCQRLYDASLVRSLNTPYLWFLKGRIQVNAAGAREMRFKFYKGMASIKAKPPKVGHFHRITVVITVKRDKATDLLHYRGLRMYEGGRKPSEPLRSLRLQPVEELDEDSEEASDDSGASTPAESAGQPATTSEIREALEALRAQETALEEKWKSDWMQRVIGAFNMECGDLDEWEVRLEEVKVDAAKLVRLFRPEPPGERPQSSPADA